MRTPFLWIPTLAAALFLSACGIGNGDDLTDVIVSPHDGAAVHGSGTDAVQFKAIGVYQAMGQYSVSYTKDLNTANWTTSDGANTTVDAQGLATCIGHTPTPAIVTASRKNDAGDTISGGAFLACD
jgi:hypothetical protein